MSIKALRTLCKRFYRLGSARGLFLDYNALQTWRKRLKISLSEKNDSFYANFTIFENARRCRKLGKMKIILDSTESL